MQVPTCNNIRIRSAQDAHKIFYAIQQGLLRMVTRRLDADERSVLGTGCVYAWEERGPHSEITGLGIERFTEGRRWSPSRVRDEFLFYYEKFVLPPETLSGSLSEKGPPRDWDPLIKQTYSVWVDTEKGRRKWHLTAYFTQGTVDRLGTVDDISGVRELVVPNGLFKSTRTIRNRNKLDEPRSSDKLQPLSASVRTYAPFPSPTSYPTAHPHQNHSTPEQPHALSSQYAEHIAYHNYCQTQAQSPHFSSYESSNQTIRTHSGEIIQCLPSSRVDYNDTSPKHEIYAKAYIEPPYVPIPHNVPDSYNVTQLPNGQGQISEGSTYMRMPSTHGTSSLFHSFSRGYESASYPIPNTLAIEPPDYMFGLPEPIIPHPTTDPLSPNLPPLRSVEGIQASVHAFATPGDVLVPEAGRKCTVGPNGDLAPLQSFARSTYRREAQDEKTLRRLRLKPSL
ncbi:hypothetical protein APHAL10511_003638 [Amanita phalloides]|nr:hypothetical protein APHAL10511_003638 [Amanita phalloides]